MNSVKYILENGWIGGLVGTILFVEMNWLFYETQYPNTNLTIFVALGLLFTPVFFFIASALWVFIRDTR